MLGSSASYRVGGLGWCYVTIAHSLRRTLYGALFFASKFIHGLSHKTLQNEIHHAERKYGKVSLVIK